MTRRRLDGTSVLDGPRIFARQGEITVFFPCPRTPTRQHLDTIPLAPEYEEIDLRFGPDEEPFVPTLRETPFSRAMLLASKRRFGRGLRNLDWDMNLDIQEMVKKISEITALQQAQYEAWAKACTHMNDVLKDALTGGVFKVPECRPSFSTWPKGNLHSTPLSEAVIDEVVDLVEKPIAKRGIAGKLGRTERRLVEIPIRPIDHIPHRDRSFLPWHKR